MKFSPLSFCLLLCALALSGCVQAPAAASSQSGSSAVPPAQSSQGSGSAAESENSDNSYGAQLQLLAEHAKLWLGDTEFIAEPYFYAVTDLDQNGRLEILQSSCQGTGLYTYTCLWEVGEELDMLNEIAFPTAEGDSQPDIITAAAAAYRDGADGPIYYLFDDDLRSGAAEHYQTRSALSLQQGVLSVQTLASRHTVYAADGSSIDTYADATGGEITAADYDAVVQMSSAGCINLQATFGWTDGEQSPLMADLPQAELAALLEASWNRFSLT